MIGKGSQKLQRILSGGIAQFLVLDNANAESYNVAEHRLEHGHRGLREVNERNEDLGEVVVILGFLQLWKSSEDFGEEAVVLFVL